MTGRLRDERDVRRLGPLRTLAGFELDLCTLCKALVAVPSNVAVMNEEILAAVLRRDEAVALRVVEPLDGSSCHKNTSPTPSRTGRGGEQSRNRYSLLISP